MGAHTHRHAPGTALSQHRQRPAVRRRLPRNCRPAVDEDHFRPPSVCARPRTLPPCSHPSKPLCIASYPSTLIPLSKAPTPSSSRTARPHSKQHRPDIMSYDSPPQRAPTRLTQAEASARIRPIGPHPCQPACYTMHALVGQTGHSLAIHPSLPSAPPPSLSGRVVKGGDHALRCILCPDASGQAHRQHQAWAP